MNWLLNKSFRSPDTQSDPTPNTPESETESLLFDEVISVAQRAPQIRLADYDLTAVREQIIRPIAAYIQRVRTPSASAPMIQPPLIVSGEPGIGKTTLLMMIDQALRQIPVEASLSCWDLLAGGAIAGYYSDFKGCIEITPLTFQQTPTAVLSIVDWRNIQRHWTYDSQRTFRESPEAIADFIAALRGKVVFVDDAEREGHIYFVSQLAQHGILVVISSNLDHKTLHMDDITPLAAHLTGIDHRVGDISTVGLPNTAHALFDALRDASSASDQKRERIKVIDTEGKRIAYASWSGIKDQPFLKDTFAEYFRKHRVQGVLLDEFPFFSGLKTQDIDPGVLGYLYRFVHLIDAVHDVQLPFLLRMTRSAPLPSDYTASEIEQSLRAYDQKIGGLAGATAWVEIARSVSRLRSRQALNEAFFNVYLVPSSDANG